MLSNLSATPGIGRSKDKSKDKTGVVREFRYRQEVLVFWKDEDDTSPPNENDYYPAVVAGSTYKDPTEEGKYRVQYQAEGDKKGKYTGESGAHSPSLLFDLRTP